MVVVYILLLLLSAVDLAHAARTVTSEGLIPVKLEIGQPTVMVFPEEVSTITTAMPEARLMISKDNVTVGFVLLDPTMPPNRQVVVGFSGKPYLVLTELAAPGKRGDDLVYVTHKLPSQRDLFTPVSVIRDLHSPQGSGAPQPLTLALPNPSDTRVRLVRPQQYAVGQYQALVMTIENTQPVALELDDRVGEPVETSRADLVPLQGWIWAPGRRVKAVAVDHTVLPPQGSTTLYVVFEEK